MVVVNCEFRRGQVWYVRDGESFGHEEAIGRPALIVSSDMGVSTSPVLQVCYLTTKPRSIGTAVEILNRGRRSWVLCEQIMTVDKRRLGEKMCDITEAEMLKVDLGLRTVFGLSSKPSESDKLLAEREAEFSEKTEELTSKIAELELELTVHKRLYEKALDKLVEQRFTKDCSPEVTPIVESPKVEVAPKMEEPELNLSGLAEKFKVYDERQKATKKVVSPKIVDGKPNVNDSDWQTIMALTGISDQTAKSIVNYRKSHGKYVSLEDLLYAPRVGKRIVEKISEVMEVR